MTAVVLSASVVAVLHQWEAVSTTRAHQLSQRTRHLFDLLAAADETVACAQIKVHETATDSFWLVRPIPHAVFYFTHTPDAFVGLTFCAHTDQQADRRAVQRASTAAHRLRRHDLPLADWPAIRTHFGATPTTDALLIDTLSTLQATRHRRQITASSLATKMDLPLAQLAKIERIDAVPSISTLQRYAQALDLTLDLQVDA